MVNFFWIVGIIGFVWGSFIIYDSMLVSPESRKLEGRIKQLEEQLKSLQQRAAHYSHEEV